MYKIGTTKSTPNRIRGLQTGNPLQLSLIKYYKSELYQKIETILHRRLKHKKYIPEDFENLKGEWFNLEIEDVLNFIDNCKKIEESINYLKKTSTLDIIKNL